MFRKLIATSPTWATLPLRLFLAVSFIGHGAQKVFGALGGPGLSKFASGGEAMTLGLRPAWLWLGAAAFAELLGGISLLLGLVTRVGAFLILCTMVVALILGWQKTGAFFIQNQGIEPVYWLIGMALALVIAGGGRASVDESIQASSRGRRKWKTSGK
jgi:putative oxidoreductase